MRYKMFLLLIISIFSLPVISHAEYKHYDLYLKAHEMKAQKNYKEALSLFNKVIKANPDFAGVRLNKGGLLFEMGRFDDALKIIDEYIAMKPEDGEGWYNKGTILLNMKNYADALDAFEKAVNLDPTDHEKWFNHGMTLWALNRHDDALASFRKIISMGVDFPDAYIQSINLLFGQKRYQEAIGICDEVIKIQPGLGVGYAYKGLILMDSGRFNHAREANPKMTTMSSDSRQASVNLCRNLVALKRYDEADSAIEKALSLNPKYEAAIQLKKLASEKRSKGQ